MPNMRAFKNINLWVFDLDNTLYPPECNLFAQVDQNMQRFIHERLGYGWEEARGLQKKYFREYGTTLRGLMSLHGIPPHEFLEFVHDIDFSVIAPNPRLEEAISALPGRRIIYTNASRQHTQRVIEQLGIDNCFDGIFDIADSEYVPKPNADSMARFLQKSDFEPWRAAMFEDLPNNLIVPAELGMTTILVRPRHGKHPDAPWLDLNENAAHIHHRTDDLAGFLTLCRR